jgi:hypothetical protein
MDARQRLLERIGDINTFDRPRPVVTLEEFFDGNEDPGSIGCNLPEAVGPQEFFTFLVQLRMRQDISTVLVEVTQHDDPDDWPFSDTIWIVTSLSQGALARLFPERLRPDEWRTYPPDYEIEPIRCPAGTEAFAAWYD